MYSPLNDAFLFAVQNSETLTKFDDLKVALVALLGLTDEVLEWIEAEEEADECDIIFPMDFKSFQYLVECDFAGFEENRLKNFYWDFEMTPSITSQSLIDAYKIYAPSCSRQTDVALRHGFSLLESNIRVR